MKILAVDYGTKRVGLATCDELQLTTRGLDTFASRGIPRDAEKVLAVAKRLESGAILVGLPLHLDGTRGRSAERAIALARCLRAADDRPVHLVDERLTSREADEQLRAHGKRVDKKLGARDQQAARIILEDYLRLGMDATVPVR